MNKYTLTLLLITISFVSFSQIVTINNNADTESNASLQTLIENVLITGTCAQIDNFTEQTFGASTNLQNKSYGYFKKVTGSNFPFDSGLILSTGRAAGGGNTSNTNLVSNDLGMAGDTDLQTALGITNTNDATYIKWLCCGIM